MIEDPSTDPSRYAAVVSTPIGLLGVVVADSALTELDFLADWMPRIAPRSEVALRVAEQLLAYFTTPGFKFSLPLAPAGTPFQRKLWLAMSEIPCGETQTYGQLAARIASSARAVGGGCRANPIPIVIPCHRVVAQTGLGGYMGEQAGASFSLKRALLLYEGARI